MEAGATVERPADELHTQRPQLCLDRAREPMVSDVGRIGHDCLEPFSGRIEHKVGQLHMAQIIGRKSVDAGLLEYTRVDFCAGQLDPSAGLGNERFGATEEGTGTDRRIKDGVSLTDQDVGDHRIGDPTGSPELPLLTQGFSCGAGMR